MKRLGTTLQWMAGAALLAAAAAVHVSLTHSRTARAETGAPPVVAFATVVLGGFRGIAADFLWLRATALQDEGRFFELTQLADWITQLEPHNAEVWSYHAWNMAYNVSSMLSSPEDRWRWVQNGLHLLRDKAIPANPDEPDLYAELAWLFQHKIGESYDPSHRAYKHALAREMTTSLGGPRPDYPRELESGRDGALVRHRLDPKRMREVENRYGPLDWRLAATHAIYWAALGREAAGGRGSMRCERIIYQSMAASFFEGQLKEVTPAESFSTEPCVRLLPYVVRTFERAISEHPRDSGVAEAYAGFLRGAVLVLDASGRADEARELFESLRGRFPAAVRSGSLESYVKDPRSMDDLGPRVQACVWRMRKERKP